MIKNEKQINKSLQKLMRQGIISDKIYQRLRSTGSQPARFYGLAKVHRKDTSLRPVFSIPGSNDINSEGKIRRCTKLGSVQKNQWSKI